MKSKSAATSLTPSLQRRLERHFLTCSAAVGAVAALGAPEAQASVVYYDIPDTMIPLNDGAGIYFNLETGGFSGDFNAVLGWDLNIFNPNTTGLFAFTPTTPAGGFGLVGYVGPFGYNYASKLAAGAPIDSLQTFFNGPTTMNYVTPPGGQWLNGDGYLGVRFQLADASIVYGWVHVVVTGALSATVTEMAYETTGGQIIAGAIPEPSSVALSFIAAGAAGLVYWRRRKAAAA